MRLGRLELKQIGIVDRPTVFYDDDLKGFGLRVMPPSSRSIAGTRSWIVEYRPGKGGRRVAKRRLVLGRVDSLSPERARQAARDILARARLGEDPAEARSVARSASTVSELGPRYLTETNVLRKPRTAELYRGIWKRYIEPQVGHIQVPTLGRAEVEGMHRRIGASHPSTANRAVILISHFYGWAQIRGLAPRESVNPARGIRKFKEHGRERYLTTDELGRLGEALREAETTGIEWQPDLTKAKAKHAPKRRETRLVRIGPFATAAIKLLVLTGARLREVLHLEWAHVDLERGMLFLPDSKTGRKSLVLGAPAIDILTQLATASEGCPIKSKFVIHGATPDRPRADLKRPWKLVSEHAGLKGVRLHDLRHSFASVGAGAGMGLPLIGRLLGHADPATTARYAHLDADPVRRASNLVSGAISAALNGALGQSTEAGE